MKKINRSAIEAAILNALPDNLVYPEGAGDAVPMLRVNLSEEGNVDVTFQRHRPGNRYVARDDELFLATYLLPGTTSCSWRSAWKPAKSITTHTTTSTSPSRSWKPCAG